MALHNAAFLLPDAGPSAGRPPLVDRGDCEPRAAAAAAASESGPAPGPARAPQMVLEPAGLDAPGPDLGPDWTEQFMFEPRHDEPPATMAPLDPVLSIFGPHDAAGPFHTSDFAAALAPAPGQAVPAESLGLAEFFLKNGAWRPPEPCSYCRRRRLQCIMLPTTEANPNPVHSCSVCVAHFRQCSLAERPKRQPSAFETPAPVIGHLHGVSEEGDPALWGQPALVSAVASSSSAAGQAPPTPGIALASGKRYSSRSVRRTQVLRDWFSANIDHPYPTDEEKSALADQAGLTRTQVINWFTNARRRHRLSNQPMANTATFRAGSPMPWSLLSSLSPFERWRHSPPEGEPVSNSAMAEAPDAGGNQAGPRDGSDQLAAPAFGSAAMDDSMLLTSPAHHRSSEASLSSVNSHRSLVGDVVLPGRSPEDPGHPPWAQSPDVLLPKPRNFPCKYCLRAFSKKYDWLRHEKSVHTPGGMSWVCNVPVVPGQSFVLWRVGKDQSECIFCGHLSPNEEHLQSHEFEACATRSVQDRSFLRKDHMWQHLYKFHGCRKWEGWKLDLDLLQHQA